MNVQSGNFLCQLWSLICWVLLLGVFAAYAIKQNSSPAFKTFLTAGILGHGVLNFFNGDFTIATKTINGLYSSFVYVMRSVMGGVLLVYLGYEDINPSIP